MIYQTSTQNLEATLSLGEKIGQNLNGDEVIELIGDIGSGKTALTRGMVKGFGSNDAVASPSFTLSRVYKRDDGKQVNHFDFYRLEEAGIMQAEIIESINSEDTVVVIEWAELVEGVLPHDRLRIKIGAGKDEEFRNFNFKTGAKHNHLLDGLTS